MNEKYLIKNFELGFLGGHHGRCFGLRCLWVMGDVAINQLMGSRTMIGG